MGNHPGVLLVLAEYGLTKLSKAQAQAELTKIVADSKRSCASDPSYLVASA
jgi:hypothetical protein